MPQPDHNQTFLTVGHSNRSLEEFLEMVLEHRVEHVVDVRRLPGSHAYPHFNQDVLDDALAKEGVKYRRIETLAGRRGREHNVPDEVNGFWRNRSFHNYADYAMSEPFHTGLAELLHLGETARVAIMCAEAVWWRCHRRLIADHLLVRKIPVEHLMGPNRTVEATLTDGAVFDANTGLITYPAES